VWITILWVENEHPAADQLDIELFAKTLHKVALALKPLTDRMPKRSMKRPNLSMRGGLPSAGRGRTIVVRGPVRIVIARR
jgi:hypothetical protein